MFSEDHWNEIRAAGQQIAETLLLGINQINQLIEDATRFGEHGWPLHPDWDSSDLAALVDALEHADCDDVFTAFYDAGDGVRIRQTFSNLATRETMSRWQSIIQQSEQALEQDQYALIVPALLTVLEGRVFISPSRSTAVKNEIKSNLDVQTDDFSRMVWQTILDYVNALFERSDFEGAEPPFNRHWILHGRASTGWNRSDVVRLLHGVYVIDSVLDA